MYGVLSQTQHFVLPNVTRVALGYGKEIAVGESMFMLAVNERAMLRLDHCVYLVITSLDLK